jgi:hypothetical protein
MFHIDKGDNSIKPLKARSFSELGFKERLHLQEWIAKYPSCLGEDLLIIQKEFAGFSDTQERLDLLALDNKGRLVIIENKLDDTGKDVTWQAIKYASYCVSLKTESICGIYQDHLIRTGQPGAASELIADFLEVADLSEVTLNRGVSQRIMLIAANFRKEVTSTVLWLMNFKLQIQCFKVTPWSMADDLFLNVEQIIPVKDTQDFVIGLADKAQDEIQYYSAEAARHTIRREFWGEVIRVMQTKSRLYNNISAGVANWIGAGSGVLGVRFNFATAGKYGRAEIYIGRGEQAENKYVFDQLFAQREALEEAFGGPLVWERLDHRRACRIKCETEANIFEREDWPVMIEFMTDAMVRIEKAFRDPLQKLNADARSRTFEPEADEEGS